MANVKYYQPEFMGGSKSKAIEYFLKSETVYLKQKLELINGNWLYLNVLAMIAISYTEFQEYEKAEVYYKKILAIQPNYGWIKDKMLPDLVKKMKG